MELGERPFDHVLDGEVARADQVQDHVVAEAELRGELRRAAGEEFLQGGLGGHLAPGLSECANSEGRGGVGGHVTRGFVLRG